MRLPRRVLRSGAAVLLAAVALACGACSTKKTVQPDVPPKTTLFVQFDPGDGTPHSVYHIARLHWFGSDVDGYVTGYDIRFVFPGGPADPPWTRTTQTDSLFVIPDPTGVTNPTFQVRAVDDDGVVDPNPRSQQFTFTNRAPFVLFVDPIGATETTFASQTIDWQGIDPDGDAGLLTYYVWLDGNEANPHQTTGTEFTFPTADFNGPNGRLRMGPRTAFVKAVDAGGRESPVVSVSWQVRSPAPDTNLVKGKLLIIDDIRTVPSTESGNSAFENFYNAAITRSGVPASSTRIIQLGSGRFFRSTKDLEQSLRLFDAVVWYRGQIPYGGQPFDPNRDSLIVLHADGIAAYVDQGGRFYIESPDLIAVGTENGLLTQDFMRAHLGADFVFRRLGATDSTASWSYASSVGGNPATLRSTAFPPPPPSPPPSDILNISSSGAGIRAFRIRDTTDVVLWARAGNLDVAQTYDIPVAIRSTTVAGGCFVVSGLPMLAAGGQTGGGRFIDKVFSYLGVAP